MTSASTTTTTTGTYPQPLSAAYGISQPGYDNYHPYPHVDETKPCIKRMSGSERASTTPAPGASEDVDEAKPAVPPKERRFKLSRSVLHPFFSFFLFAYLYSRAPFTERVIAVGELS